MAYIITTNWLDGNPSNVKFWVTVVDDVNGIMIFIFLMLFETVYALATNDLSLLSDHFKTYINDLSPVTYCL